LQPLGGAGKPRHPARRHRPLPLRHRRRGGLPRHQHPGELPPRLARLLVPRALFPRAARGRGTLARARRRGRAMTKDARKLDLLPEQLAPEEVEQAHLAHEKGGMSGLLARARAALHAAEAARVRFETLANALEARPNDRISLVSSYLRESTRDADVLKADLRALNRRRDVFDLPALAERLAKETTDAEILSEACVALARRILDEHTAPQADPATLIELARVPGRWSRRCEAIRLLRDLARYPVPPDARMAVASA